MPVLFAVMLQQCDYYSSIFLLQVTPAPSVPKCIHGVGAGIALRGENADLASIPTPTIFRSELHNGVNLR